MVSAMTHFAAPSRATVLLNTARNAASTGVTEHKEFPAMNRAPTINRGATVEGNYAKHF